MAVVTDADRLLDAKLGDGAGLGGALAAENLATMTAVMLSLNQAELSPACIAPLSLHPVWGLLSNKHGVTFLELWERVSFSLELTEGVADNLETGLVPEGLGPGLEEFQGLGLDGLVARQNELLHVIHKLWCSNFFMDSRSTVLHTRLQNLKSVERNSWVLVIQLLPYARQGILWSDILLSDGITDLKCRLPVRFQ